MTEEQKTALALRSLADALVVLPPSGGKGGQGDDGDGDQSQEDQEGNGEDDSSSETPRDKSMSKALKPTKPRDGQIPENIQAIIQDNRDATDPPPNPRGPPRLVSSEIMPEYRVHPEVKDRILTAETYMTELRVNPVKARVRLDGLMWDDSLVGRLATKLLRLIMAQQTRSWNFDQEDGLLDPARLARIVSSPTLPAAYRTERESDFKDTAVTLLLDNSGSMMGTKIEVVAVVADVLSRSLERCGVTVEVLGWSSLGSVRHWEDNRIRIDNLRHIIYKDASVPYRRVRNNFGLMVANSSFLQQNVDGEALIWAYNRLVSRPQPRRILMVLSDGEPSAETDGHVLAAHLRRVIAEIEGRNDVELLAIGALHDVSRWYRHAITVRNVESIGPVLMTELTKLFDPREQKKRLMGLKTS